MGNRKILVTGGAGYIGAITAQILKSAGYTPLIFDNFSNGVREAVAGLETIEGDLRNIVDIQTALSRTKPDAVIHFAGLKAAAESMEVPEEYYENNVGGSANLFKAMVHAGVHKVVFSSSAAIYGQPVKNPIHEDDPKIPTSVYGHSKLQVEEMLHWYGQLDKLDSICLRYFNVAGAMEDGLLGEASPKLLNLVPLVIQAALGEKEFTLYGSDYHTPDGTCIRDYIHVVDLAHAHVKALDKLFESSGYEYFNVGIGKGYSNLEVINEVKDISGVNLQYKVGERRVGDPAQIFADTAKIKRDLGWEPMYGLKEIIAHAWKWHQESDESKSI